MVHLSDLNIGEKAKIISYSICDPNYRRKLLTLGLLPGTVLKVIGIAPFGDPIEINARGFSICLRKKEASILNLEKIVG